MRAATSKSWSMGVLSLAAALACALLAGCPSNIDLSHLTPQQRAQARLIHRGRLIFDQTHKYAPKWVGNQLACGDCHLQSGTAAYAVPMIDVAGLFPMYSKRAGRVISLQERIQECFVRSESGKPLPKDSPQMHALVAYINWLSRNQVGRQPYQERGLIKLPALKGDPVRGKAVYDTQCAVCHRRRGVGLPPVIPAMWGRNSYNDGAGMNDPGKLAAFVAHNMPKYNPSTLTPQQAYDIAAFIHTMPRPRLNKAYRHY
ncbi:MAG TPA: c-type cytochrome [Acidobacteriaceae bacterium]|nr:c-type cytochrome [Acidobacteriaceae bacterium]